MKLPANQNYGRKAFTLIELLIVVAIIAILAAIAVPNFLEAQTRAKVSRAKSDMRSIKVGMEAYHIDHNRYVPDLNGMPGHNAADEFSTWTKLTTPVAYLTSVIYSPFQGKGGNFDNNPYGSENVYEYWGPGFFESNAGVNITANRLGIKYVVAALGPNLQRDFIGTTALEYERLNNNGAVFIYDPTNGTTSAGDILGSNKVPFYGQ